MKNDGIVQQVQRIGYQANSGKELHPYFRLHLHTHQVRDDTANTYRMNSQVENDHKTGSLLNSNTQGNPQNIQKNKTEQTNSE